MNHPSKIVVIDDDSDMRWAIRSILTEGGYDVAEARAGGEGLEIIGKSTPDAVLLDICMPGINGEEVLRRLRRLDDGLPVIMITAFGSIPGAVDAMQAGAFEYITKPFRNEQLVEIVRRAVQQRYGDRATAAAGVRPAITGVMGQGPSIQRLADQIEAVVATDYSVLIHGETGTGKEVVARTLHQQGPRAGRPFVVVDCGTVAESLTDSEFFGHEKGAYTGANGRHRGWFEVAAGGGTMFLDEIGNLPLTGQKALLRALEERVIHRVGGTEMIDVDVRVVAATNDDLKERSKIGNFRGDLFFRLSEYIITVPPLRTRPEDVPFLAKRFVDQARASLGRPPAEIDPAALDLLCGYRWPGNVRELRNVMRRAALVASGLILPGHVVGHLGDDAAAAVPPAAAETSLRGRVQDRVRAVERDAVLDALKQAGGNKAQAARLLGIDYKTYRTKLKLFCAGHGAIADERC